MEAVETVGEVEIDEFHLINLVRPNEVLYKKVVQNAKIAEQKELLWQGIALQLGVASAERCRRRWLCIRERYSRECRRLERGLTKEIWPFLDILSFLYNYVKPRHRDGSYKVGQNHAPVLVSPKPSASPPSDPLFSSEDYIDETATSTTAWPRNLQTDESNTVDTDTEPPKFDDSVGKICQYNNTLDNSSKYQISNGGNRAVHFFGEMIVATICEMSPRMQAKAMRQVTELVMTLKLEDVDDSNILKISAYGKEKRILDQKQLQRKIPKYQLSTGSGGSSLSENSSRLLKYYVSNLFAIM